MAVSRKRVAPRNAYERLALATAPVKSGSWTAAERKRRMPTDALPEMSARGWNSTAGAM